MSLVNVEKLTHGFTDKYVFQDISFRLLKGEHVGLVGANGAGKSTLLNILSGQLIPDQGKVEWLPHVQQGFLEQHIDLQQGTSMREYLREAFADLYDLEKKMMKASEDMATAGEDKLNTLFEKFSRLQEDLEQSGFYEIDAKIDDVAGGLGLTAVGLDQDVSLLSGGQRTKLLLAKLLLQKPDVLLLDEPTNYLDTAHIEWFSQYLKRYSKAFILISHDTAFMNDVVGLIYHLEHKTLTRYVGDYQQFLKAYEMRSQQHHKAYEKQQKDIERMETFVKKNKARASTSKRAKSREKQLNKIERIEKPTKLPRPKFDFKVASKPVSKMIEAEGLQVGYQSALYQPVDLTINRGDKIAVLGHNGVGKTTTVKTLLGQLSPYAGHVQLGDRIKPAYFQQEAASQQTRTALQEVWQSFPDLDEKDVRQHLARCGLKSEHIFKAMKELSGGEQTKVRLCKLMLESSNWLILDEPTNHLDVQAKEALKESLSVYKGTVLVVTHEPSFIEGWVTKTWDIEAWRS